jgi:hypothetical protein
MALSVVVMATLLTVTGEVHATLLGFSIQMLGQVLETARIILQALLLAGKGLKLDVLTYMLLVYPACTVILGCFLASSHFSGLEMGNAVSPSLSQINMWWPVLMANCLVSVALNLSTVLLLKITSPMCFVLSHIIKDSVILVGGLFVFNETIAIVQVVAFIAQISGIASYSLMKQYPDHFEDGITAGFMNVFMSVFRSPVREEVPINDSTSGYGGANNC